MKKSFKLLALILTFAALATLFTAFAVVTPSAAIVEIKDNKEAQVIEATAEGISVSLNWTSGYITVPNKNGVKAFYRSENTECCYTDVITVAKAGTEITFSDSATFLTNGGYVISSWAKNADGYWVGDADGANYYGMAEFTSRVQSKNANGGIDYKYVTSKDNETIRIGYRLGSGQSAYPEIKFKLTGEKGTYAKELEDENAPITFANDGKVSGVYWTCGYIGSSTNPNGYPGGINPGSANFAFSSIVKVEKAGTVISFTDAAGTGYAADNAYVISHWKKDASQNRYYIDESKQNFPGNSGNDNVVKSGDTVVFTEKKNSDGSVTYTYVTKEDNEVLRFCYHTGSTFDTVPSKAAEITWTNESGDVGDDVFDADTAFTSHTFISGTSRLVLPYRLHLPKDYDESKTYPLILFLHGAGERGIDNKAQLKNGILVPFNDPSSPIHDCIVIAPQCPTGYKWVEVPSWKECNYSTQSIAESFPLKAAFELLESVIKDYSVDADRVYATGLSMGGYGTWDLLARHGDVFAAAIPVCGGVDVSLAKQFKDIPIYTFHGMKDTTVPPTGTVNVVNTIKNLGGEKITLVTYADAGHSIWNTAYGTEGLFEWLLSHKLSDRKEDEAEDTTTEAQKPADTTAVPTDTTSVQSPSVTTQAPDNAPSDNSTGGCGNISLALAVAFVGIASVLGFAIIKKH